MPAEVLAHGREPADVPDWAWRSDRVTRALAAAVVVTGLLGVAVVHDARQPDRRPAVATRPSARVEAARVVVRSVDPAPGAAVTTAAGGLVVRPVDEPSTAAARRVAQLVANRLCTNLERPRFRRERGSADGRTASYVVGRASDTPRKAAGFLLDLTWRDGAYLARVTEAYGGCAGG